MVKVEKGPRVGTVKGPGGDMVPSKFGSTQTMATKAANVKVVVRVRPMNERELNHSSRRVVDVIDDRMLVFDPIEESQPFFYQGVAQPNKNYLKRKNKELKFCFDHVCHYEATNQEVFEAATKDILPSLMEGYNCSVFVYGATGAGKTFTMIGNHEHPGITYLTMEHLFYMLESYEKDMDFDIGVSYLEVYNEHVYDLIRPSKTPLQLREDAKYGVMVAGLTLNSIKTAKQLLNMLENGNKNRTQHPTDANAESSRSHAVFQVYIKMSNKTSSQYRMVKLSMIDLAGSERASATGCVGERFKEGANINRSLLSLANCINKLADGCAYIPYRDSKLTRLLKDSLGGNCKTVMIANISPSASTYEDTYNTLKYADRANKIQLNIKKNIMDGGVRAGQYVKINEELKKKVKELEAKLTLSSVQKCDTEAQLKMMKANEELKKKVKEMEEKVLLANSRPANREEFASKRDADRGSREWRQRVLSAAETSSTLLTEALSLMSVSRVLALRRRLRARAFHHLVDLVHRSSTEAMEQMCNEEIPRQERAAEKYTKEALRLNAKIMSAWSKWNESKKNLDLVCQQALTASPDLQDLVERIQAESQLQHCQAKNELNHKLLSIQNEEINAFTDYMSDMPNMLKKLYLTLKGYEKVTPTLTAEYMKIMKKAKSAEGITWSDANDINDKHFKHIVDLDLEKPLVLENLPMLPKLEDSNATVDFTTDSETDQENREPVRFLPKRKGTPIKLVNNDTIIIDDSFENFDVTRTMNSAKKMKKEYDYSSEDNYVVRPNNVVRLNSTFDMTGKIEALKTQIRTENAKVPLGVKRELADTTNTIQKPFTFGDKVDKARIVKPVVGRAVPVRRPPAAQPAGFGSSLARDGTPLHRTVQGQRKVDVTQRSVGFKAVRSRERVQTHPYSRPRK